MLGIVKTVGAFFATVGKALDVFGWFQRRAERNEYREEGAQGQRLADAEKTIEDKNDQLQKAVDHKPGTARDRLRSGDF